MRVAIGGFCHESNAFGSNKVTLQVMQAGTTEKEILVNHASKVRSYPGGYIHAARELGVELVPTTLSVMSPAGPVTKEAFETARDRLLELLQTEYEKRPYDAIALFMHGAGMCFDYPDIEGAILKAIRAKFGMDMPVGIALDLHGNITEDMKDLSDLLLGCKNYPHTDEYDAGYSMFCKLVDMVQNKKTIYKKLIKLPWLMVPAQGTTMGGPAADIRQMCIDREEQDPELVAASFFQGFPYSDIQEASVSVITMALTQEAADRNAMDIARYAWSRRKDMDDQFYSAEAAVALALKEEKFPVLINESADNPGGGCPGDGTYLLRALLDANVPSAFGFIYDPEVAKQATEAGVGATISCRLGGKTDMLSGESIELPNAYVKCISDGSFYRKSEMGKGIRTALGPTACLVVGNVSIVVSCARVQTFDDGPFLLGGVDWYDKKILALKSSQHFKGWWADKVAKIIPCDPPGVMSADLTTFPFRNVNRDYYPLNPDRVAEEIE